MGMNLFRAMSYKEWMKTRRQVLVFFLLFVAVTVYSYIDLTYAIRMNEAVNVWYAFIFQDAAAAPLMMYVMPLAGISLAVVQYVPEMTNKRFKLTLHLPASENRIVTAMLLYGYAVLAVLYLLSALVLAFVMHLLLPVEVVGRMLQQLLPWMAAGMAGYGFAAWICIEPQWKQRILTIILALGLMAVFFVSLKPGAYSGFGWGMLLLVVASFFFPFYACIRFKQGVQ